MSARTYTIGTAADCDVRVTNEYASARHARVSVSLTGRAAIEDLGSTNGTWIRRNGQMQRVIAPVPLLPGDIIRVGRTDVTWNGEPR